MNAKANNIISELNKVCQRIKKPLTIVETGTIRNSTEAYEPTDGHSTKYISEWIRDNEPLTDFYSIDLDTSACLKYMVELGLIQHVELIQSDSRAALVQLINIDFAYLDSGNDAELIMQEFLIVWPKLTRGGCIVIDDCNTDRADLLKGDLLIPYVIENDLRFNIFNTNQMVIYK